MRREDQEAIELLAMALGTPVATPPEHDYRVFLFDCPVCNGELLDPEGIHLPLKADTDGFLGCYYGCDTATIVDACELLIGERLA